MATSRIMEDSLLVQIMPIKKEKNRTPTKKDRRPQLPPLKLQGAHVLSFNFNDSQPPGFPKNTSTPKPTPQFIYPDGNDKSNDRNNKGKIETEKKRSRSGPSDIDTLTDPNPLDPTSSQRSENEPDLSGIAELEAAIIVTDKIEITSSYFSERHLRNRIEHR
jgi:hypothetical protein